MLRTRSLLTEEERFCYDWIMGVAKQYWFHKKYPERQKESQRKWRAKNPDYMPRYYLEHKETYEENRLRRHAIPEKKAKYKATAKRYKKNVASKKPYYQIRSSIHGRMKIALKLNAKGRARKSAHLEELLGCSIEYFKNYIASMFKPGMTWENRSFETWHLDHKIPCKNFDLRDPEQQKICFNYKNYQPLWKLDNLRKGDKTILFPLNAPAGDTQQETQPIAIARELAAAE